MVRKSTRELRIIQLKNEYARDKRLFYSAIRISEAFFRAYDQHSENFVPIPQIGHKPSRGRFSEKVEHEAQIAKQISRGKKFSNRLYFAPSHGYRVNTLPPCTLKTESRCRKDTKVRSLAKCRFVGAARERRRKTCPSTQGSGTGKYRAYSGKANLELPQHFGVTMPC